MEEMNDREVTMRNYKGDPYFTRISGAVLWLRNPPRQVQRPSIHVDNSEVRSMDESSRKHGAMAVVLPWVTPRQDVGTEKMADIIGS